jgi:MOSC domain-containing protein YiiM
VIRGRLVSIHVATDARLPMLSREQVKAVEGKGLEGDRYFARSGTFSSSPGGGREVTLIEIEAIEALRRANVLLEAGEARRNLVTRGVPLNHLVGRTFHVGEVRLRGVRLCEPCEHLEGLTREGVLRELVHRGGLRADIVSGGTIRVGDEVTDALEEENKT